MQSCAFFGFTCGRASRWRSGTVRRNVQMLLTPLSTSNIVDVAPDGADARWRERRKRRKKKRGRTESRHHAGRTERAGKETMATRVAKLIHLIETGETGWTPEKEEEEGAINDVKGIVSGLPPLLHEVLGVPVRLHSSSFRSVEFGTELSKGE